MRREYEKQPNGTGKVRFLMEMDRETGEFESAFPVEMPAGHRLVYRWGNDGGPQKKQRFVGFEIEPDPAKLAPGTVELTSIEFDGSTSTTAYKFTSSPTPVQPTETGKALADAAQDAAVKELKDLEALPEADRLTLAAELGIGGSVKKGQTPLKQATAIIEARRAKK